MATPHTWKAVERRVAALFGSVRTPLSGGNSKRTRSDTLHSDVFIETKHGKRLAGVEKLYGETALLANKERKIPLVVLHAKGSTRYLVLCDLIHIEELADLMREARHQVVTSDGRALTLRTNGVTHNGTKPHTRKRK